MSTDLDKCVTNTVSHVEGLACIRASNMMATAPMFDYVSEVAEAIFWLMLFVSQNWYKIYLFLTT